MLLALSIILSSCNQPTMETSSLDNNQGYEELKKELVQMKSEVENLEQTNAKLVKEIDDLKKKDKDDNTTSSQIEPEIDITKESKKTVQLFYRNKNKDKDYSCDSDSVLPVERELPVSKTIIKDTIEELIKGKLTEKEIQNGFSTEFPNPEFKLVSLNLKEKTLYLEFNEVFGFTSGGSCRIGLLTEQIKKTALQFPEVEEVVFKPNEIFQP